MDDAGIEGIEEVVGELLAIPPESFTERRNAVAKELRAGGRRAAADAVRALPRPSVALWAINRLACEQPEVIDALLAAADELREAYRSGDDVRAATRPERDAEAAVIAAAAALVRAHGKAATDTLLQGLGQIVHAAAAGGEVAEALRSGRLMREPAAPSIDDLLGSMTGAAQPAAGGKAPAAAKKDELAAERRELREQIAAAESDASRAREEERSALDAAREARAAWDAAEAHAAQLQQSREEAGERLGELRERLERL